MKSKLYLFLAALVAVFFVACHPAGVEDLVKNGAHLDQTPGYNPGTGIGGGSGGGSGTGGGTGIEYDLIITTAQQLFNFATRVNSGETTLCAKLGADIDLGSANWTPIGNGGKTYSGFFDGNYHTISGFYVSGEYSAAGFFGTVRDGVIENLRIANGNVYGGVSTYYAGGIVGCLENGFVLCCENDSVDVDIDSYCSNCNLGGIIGKTTGSYVGNSCNKAKVKSTRYNSYIGGIVGYSESAMGIDNCYNSDTTCTGNDYYYCGAIAGYCDADVMYCYYKYSSYYSRPPIAVGGGSVIGTTSVSSLTSSFSGGFLLSGTLLENLNAWVGNNPDPTLRRKWKKGSDGYPTLFY